MMQMKITCAHTAADIMQTLLLLDYLKGTFAIK
jgi:hypothetical protein